MGFKINHSVTWVGKIDWELRTFHGEELSTHRGSSYNSYLVRDEKTALLDTVWQPFTQEFIRNLKKEVSLDEIDYIVVNHVEGDHTGALPELMREIPDTPIYCTANAVKALKGHYHQEWNFVEVKTGDRLSLGKKELVFIEARMLHWPDTMFSYLTEDAILFSNDAFGQHFASEFMYNDKVDQVELYAEAIKYYANILTPFSKLVENKVKEVLKLEMPLTMICPSHGIIWRDNPLQIVHKYLDWARDYQEDQVTILYDTMWNSTRKMAEAIAAGIQETNQKIAVKLFNSARADKNDIVTEAFRSRAILVGSPTLNKGILYSVAGILEMLKGLGLKGKKGAAFGSYGWSGEAVKLINGELEKAGLSLMADGLRTTWVPDEAALENCWELGRKIGTELS